MLEENNWFANRRQLQHIEADRTEAVAVNKAVAWGETHRDIKANATFTESIWAWSCISRAHERVREMAISLLFSH